MKLKKGWKRFWTLNRHHADGFTLVELIVVIAILAILAGVGSVGYSGYIKSAQMKRDMTTVGNILRATEVGVYSTSFELPEALQVGSKGVTFPVGFIVLTQDGAENLKTGSTYESGTQDKACHIEEITFYTVSEKKSNPVTYEYFAGIVGVGTWKDANFKDPQDYHEISPGETVQYCSTHTKLPTGTSYPTLGTAKYAKGDEFTEGIVRYRVKEGTEYNIINQPVISKADCKGLYELVTDHTEGEYRETTNIKDGTADEGNSVAVNNTVMTDIMTAAYGDSWNSLKLEYDGWTNSTMSSFFTSGSSVLNKATGYAEKVLKLPESAQTLAMSTSYKNMDEMTAALADTMAAQDKTDWLNHWKSVDDSDMTIQNGVYMYEGASFGLNSGREFYCTARLLYNACFADYVKNSTGYAHDAANHATKIDGFTKKSSDGDDTTDAVLSGLGFGLPGVICQSAFEFKASGLDSNVQNCQDCRDLYDLYRSSGASTKNAEAIYDTMAGVDETASELDKSAATSFFGSYQQYLDEFSSLYKDVQAKTTGKSAIVISVYYKDGLLSYEVSPNNANPRPAS